MICKNISPSAALKEFVRNYKLLHLKFDKPEQIPFKHRPPKPEQGIVFYIKGNVNLQNLSTGDQQIPATVSVFSHQTDKKCFLVSPEFFMFTIFLNQGILHRLTGIHAQEFKQDYHDAEQFFGIETRMVSEQLSTATGYSAMINIIENFLLTKFRQMKKESLVDQVANYLLTDPVHVPLDNVAKQACLSTKQFQRKFIERIGLSPKLFCRINRFNHAYYYKISHPNASWSSIAQEHSYTDYHHLEKEFKKFTSLTPNEWLKQNQASPERILRLK